MAKKIDKFFGMQDMFEQALNDKIAQLIVAKEKVESEIRAVESGIDNEYDNGQSCVEYRNELNMLSRELRDIELQIAKLKQNQKPSR